jgi:hypothetical protein
LITTIVVGLLESLPASWLVAQSPFRTLLSDSTTSPVVHRKRIRADAALVDLEEHRRKIDEWSQERASRR